MDDSDLVAASLADPVRFAEVFDRHFASVHRFVDRRLGPDAADTLAGEVFRIAFEVRDRYDVGRASCLPWLYGIAGKLVMREYRRRERHRRALGRLHAATVVPDRSTEVDARVDAQSAWPAVAAALDRLSEVEREVLLLVAWEELTYEEVAAALEIPIGTVRSRLHRARARVRELIGASGQGRGEEATRVTGRYQQ